VANALHAAQRHTTVLLATLVGLITLLAGCGASQLTQMSLPVTGGSEGQVGDITVRDALFSYHGPIAEGTAYQPGDTVSVQASIINQGDAADRLVPLSSPIAGGGIILGAGTIPGHHALTAGYTVPVTSITPPDTTSVVLRLTGLSTPIRSGLTYSVVFTFARAGALRLELRVQDPDVPRADCPLPPDGKAPQVLTAPLGRAPAPPRPPPPDCSSLR
jgi:hypothetical protein